MEHAKTAKLKGTITHFQTDLNDNEIPGTRKTSHNSIEDALLAYLAHCIASDQNLALDALFDDEDPATAVGGGKTDGIGFYNAGLLEVTKCFETTKNDGGDGSETYVEFYGFVTGAFTLNGVLQLGYLLADGGGGTYNFTKIFASYTINESVAASRKFHFYWKISLS